MAEKKPVITAIKNSNIAPGDIDSEKDYPQIDLRGRLISPDVLKQISEEAASFYQIIPINKKDNFLEVGMVDPTDIRAKEALKFIFKKNNFEGGIYKIGQEDFKNVLGQYRSLKGEVETALKKLERELEEKSAEGERAVGGSEEVLERVMAEAPITKIVATVLRHAYEGRASDIHVEPGETQLRIRFRVDGILHSSLLLPKQIQAAVVSRIKILSNMKIDETRIPQDGRFYSRINENKIDFRVSTLPTPYGEKVVLRLLDATSGVMDLETLGLWGRNLRLVKENIIKPFGMVLLTGPTGSGKTTTLYAIMKILNQETVNIISLEDPIEYFIEGINQSQIKPEIGYTFASGLRSILRQDPNVIMVGEIRDEETADLSVHAALTGHIVLSTLHTNNAVGVIPRFIDMGVSPFLIPSSLNLSIAQRLVRKLCQSCKKEIEVSPRVAKMIQEELSAIPEVSKQEAEVPSVIKLYDAKGCKECGGKGTKGRVALFEIISMTPQLEKLIVEGPTDSKIGEEALRQGMVTMRQDGLLKAIKGEISLQEVLRVTDWEEGVEL